MSKIIKYTTLLLSVLSLTGCFGYKEINESAIVSAISIDVNEKDNAKYDVGVQIMNAKKKENSNISEIVLYKATGNTIYEALEKITLDSPKELYLGHNEIIIIGDELLKIKDPLNYLDYFFRDPRVEKDSLILISKDNKAYDALKILTPLETIPSHNLKATLFTSSKVSGVTNITTLDEFVSYLMTTGEEVVLPSVIIKGSEEKGENIENLSDSDPDTKITFSDLGVFKDNKLIGYLNDKESLGYNLVANEAKSTYVYFKCNKNNYGNVKVHSSKTEEKLLFKNNKPSVEITNNIVADLIEYNCKNDLINDSNATMKIENKVAKRSKEMINEILDKLYKEYKTDVLKYGSKYYKNKYKEMKKLNLTKKDIKNNITFKVKTKVTLRSGSLTLKSINKEYNYEK